MGSNSVSGVDLGYLLGAAHLVICYSKSSSSVSMVFVLQNGHMT